jgi:hypothetical protein
MNRLNQTEPATFSILPCWAFFGDSVFIYFISKLVLYSRHGIAQNAKVRVVCWFSLIKPAHKKKTMHKLLFMENITALI